MNKILIPENCTPGLKRAWAEQGFLVINGTPELMSGDIETRHKTFLELLKREDFRYVFSLDFDIFISEWCNEEGITYISHTVDSPFFALYSVSASKSFNRLYTFDSDEYDALRSLGCKNISYATISTDVVNLHEAAISKNVSRERYSCDVAFMGNLYSGDNHNPYDKIGPLPAGVRQYLDAVLLNQQTIWGLDIYRETKTPELSKVLKDNIKISWINEYRPEAFDIFMDHAIGMKVAQLERRKMCDLLASRYDFKLFTGSDTSYNPEINNCGYVHYMNEMPLLFNTAKININLSLHCITAGIPLRVADILACEGFCLTSYIKGMERYFDIDKDIVVFRSFDEMCAKIDYYLSHEDERSEIAHNGYLKAKELFDYSKRVAEFCADLDEISVTPKNMQLEAIDSFIASKDIAELNKYLADLNEITAADNKLSMLFFMSKIHLSETEAGENNKIFDNFTEHTEAVSVFNELRNLVRRVEFQEEFPINALRTFIETKAISQTALNAIVNASCVDDDIFWDKFGRK